MTINETKISDVLAEITALSTSGTLPVGVTLAQTAWDHEEPYQREVLIHFFPSAVEAYDASQCTDNIIDGDLLVIPSEGVLGILIEAWPTAITVNHGEFHRRALSWDQIESGRYNEAVKAGEAIIAQWPGTEVAPTLDDWGSASAAEITTVEPWQPVVRIAWYERDGEDIAREPGGLEWTMIASAEFEGKNIARVVRTDHKNRILIATVTDCLLTNIIVSTEHDVWYVKREGPVAIIAAAMADKQFAQIAAQEQQRVTTEQIRDLLEPVDPRETAARAQLLAQAVKGVMEPCTDFAARLARYADRVGITRPAAFRDVEAEYNDVAAREGYEPLKEAALSAAARAKIVGHPSYFESAVSLYRYAAGVSYDEAVREIDSYHWYLVTLDSDQQSVTPDYDSRYEEAEAMAPEWNALEDAIRARIAADRANGGWDGVEHKIYLYALAAGIDWNQACEKVARQAQLVLDEQPVGATEDVTEVISMPQTITDRLIRTPRWVMILLALIILGSVIFIDVTMIAPVIWRSLVGLWSANVHYYHGLNSGIVIGGPKLYVGFEWHGQPGPFACVLGHGMCG